MRLRFTALRNAFSKFPRAPVAILSAAASKETLPPAGSRRARLPRGALAETAIAASGNASEESEPEPEQLPPKRKPTRQQKAARKALLHGPGMLSMASYTGGHACFLRDPR